MKTKFKTIADFLSVEPEQYNTEPLIKEVEPLESGGKGYQTFQEIEICYSKRITLTDTRIRNSNDAHTILRAIFDPVKLSVREEFVVLFLNQANHVIGYYQGFQGGITDVSVDPRLIFSIALKTLSVAILIAHNHPSGNLNPSESDKDLTSRIIKAGHVLDINVLDHIILNFSGEYLSFADKGLLT